LSTHLRDTLQYVLCCSYSIRQIIHNTLSTSHITSVCIRCSMAYNLFFTYLLLWIVIFYFLFHLFCYLILFVYIPFSFFSSIHIMLFFTFLYYVFFYLVTFIFPCVLSIFIFSILVIYFDEIHMMFVWYTYLLNTIHALNRGQPAWPHHGSFSAIGLAGRTAQIRRFLIILQQSPQTLTKSTRSTTFSLSFY
jgi:hypothetical protein